MSLFQDDFDWPTQDVILNIHQDRYYNKCMLENGLWLIQSHEISSRNNFEIRIEIAFSYPIASIFNKIVCELKTSNLLDFNIAWDFIHKIVDHSCSYESLQPLYGHFAEPYPRFTVKIRTNKPDDCISIFLNMISDYNFLSALHGYDIFYKTFGRDVDVLDIIKTLRNRGVDIRVNETNRTIPKGKFRVCYPFSIPSWQPNYTKFVTVGCTEQARLSSEHNQ